jgi:hypothetical protein
MAPETGKSGGPCGSRLILGLHIESRIPLVELRSAEAKALAERFLSPAGTPQAIWLRAICADGWMRGRTNGYRGGARNPFAEASRKNALIVSERLQATGVKLSPFSLFLWPGPRVEYRNLGDCLGSIFRELSASYLDWLMKKLRRLTARTRQVPFLV